ncbi:hypothetical protein VTO42DRAFT_4862 [Malbranchea cinnamomea]
MRPSESVWFGVFSTGRALTKSQPGTGLQLNGGDDLYDNARRDKVSLPLSEGNIRVVLEGFWLFFSQTSNETLSLLYLFCGARSSMWDVPTQCPPCPSATKKRNLLLYPTASTVCSRALEKRIHSAMSVVNVSRLVQLYILWVRPAGIRAVQRVFI